MICFEEEEVFRFGFLGICCNSRFFWYFYQGSFTQRAAIGGSKFFRKTFFREKKWNFFDFDFCGFFSSSFKCIFLCGVLLFLLKDFKEILYKVLLFFMITPISWTIPNSRKTNCLGFYFCEYFTIAHSYKRLLLLKNSHLKQFFTKTFFTKKGNFWILIFEFFLFHSKIFVI